MSARFPHPARIVEPANDLLDDPAAFAEVWQRDGCVVLRDLLPADDVVACRRDLTRRLREQGAVAAGAEEPVWSGAAVSAIDSFALYADDPAFVRLARSPALTGLLARLHGEPVHVYESVQIRFALPDDVAHTIPIHQDARYIVPDSQFAAYWIPLVDIPVGAGGLALVPGSHHRGFYDHVVSDDFFSYYMGEERAQRCIALDAVEGEWATVDFKAGDVLVFDSFVVHTALPNRTDLVRLSIDGRYQLARRPLVNWQARYSVLEGTRRRQAVLEHLGELTAADTDLREAVVAAVLAGDLPTDASTVQMVLERARAATS